VFPVFGDAMTWLTLPTCRHLRFIFHPKLYFAISDFHLTSPAEASNRVIAL
jgi:hypothetical protein